MTTQKHTPGPWACPHGSRVYGADAKLVAQTSFEHRGTRETEANAALIAAAPELLEALRALVAVWEGPRERAAMGFAAAIVTARAAIARAEGRS